MSMTTISLIIIFSTVLMMRAGLATMATHFKCRGGLYPRSKVERFPVPDDKVIWGTPYKEYAPRNYTSPHITGKPWADPEIGEPDFQPQWNKLDYDVNRESYLGEYAIINRVPRNPIGRTGIIGRGVLGRWGPNHAADPVVTRWKTCETGGIELTKDNIPTLQFVAIKRGDTGEWALPGGMVDPGERVAAAAFREFQEEAINSLQMTDDQRETWQLEFEKFFSGGEIMYCGYVDDPRNTDNAWMETLAINFHDEDGSVVGGLKLHAGDDAVGVRWVDITPDLKLYASHKDIVYEVLRKRLSMYTEDDDDEDRKKRG
ncbi:ADP-ribose pyrophosphatase, mitochondrial [Pectinophora gossypiella]|nr:ADP-ribose pyrophosphatase, mitochondrial [Pectinophora gossypiella]